jgi:hypothetical protein
MMDGGDNSMPANAWTVVPDVAIVCVTAAVLVSYTAGVFPSEIALVALFAGGFLVLVILPLAVCALHGGVSGVRRWLLLLLADVGLLPAVAAIVLAAAIGVDMVAPRFPFAAAVQVAAGAMALWMLVGGLAEARRAGVRAHPIAVWIMRIGSLALCLGVLPTLLVAASRSDPHGTMNITGALLWFDVAVALLYGIASSLIASRIMQRSRTESGHVEHALPADGGEAIR